MTEKKAKPPRAAKPKARKPKTSSAQGDAAKAHEWLKKVETQGNFQTLPGDAPADVVTDFLTGKLEERAATEAPPPPAKDEKTGRFLPGNSGGPGKPKGSRNKLGEAFLTDLQADWAEHGSAAIATVRQERPHEYLKVVASILPKELNVRVDPLEEMDDDELTAILAAARAVSRIHQEAGAGEGEADVGKPAGQLLS